MDFLKSLGIGLITGICPYLVSGFFVFGISFWVRFTSGLHRRPEKIFQSIASIGANIIACPIVFIPLGILSLFLVPLSPLILGIFLHAPISGIYWEILGIGIGLIVPGIINKQVIELTLFGAICPFFVVFLFDEWG